MRLSSDPLLLHAFLERDDAVPPVHFPSNCQAVLLDKPQYGARAPRRPGQRRYAVAEAPCPASVAPEPYLPSAEDRREALSEDGNSPSIGGGVPFAWQALVAMIIVAAAVVLMLRL